MKNQLTTSRMHQRKSLIFTMIFFVFCVGAIFSQNNITLEKVAEETPEKIQLEWSVFFL